MTDHARGSFEVEVLPLSPGPAERVNRYSIHKRLHGDLQGTTQGEMYSGGDPKQGAAGYVAIEAVTGQLGGRSGSFLLMHMATMDERGPLMQVVVVPGSGSGELKGISGRLTIKIDAGAHSYDLEYHLPDAGSAGIAQHI